MARKIDSTCSQCRRVSEKLFLKGEKCFGPHCAVTRRSYPSGQHGPNKKHRTKLSGYGKQLLEKQKVKEVYGILERQFANYVAEASIKTGDTSKFLLNYLESRLDNVVFRMGLGKSRSAARQIVNHGHVTVNGKKVDIASFRVRVGDVIGLTAKAKAKKIFEKIEEQLAKVEAPSWLAIEPKAITGKILNNPTVDHVNFDAKTIIEFYSR